MAVSYPYDMVSDYRWRRADFTTQRFDEISRDGYSHLLTKALAWPVWKAEFATAWMPLRDAEALHARFEALHGSIRTFYCVPMMRRWPAARTMQALTGVSLDTIGSDNRTLSLAGLPSGFVMTAGDYLSVTTSTGVEMLKLATGGIANFAGVTPELDITDHVRVSVLPGQPVRLVDPIAEMKVLPNGLSLDLRNKIQGSVSFTAGQVIR